MRINHNSSQEYFTTSNAEGIFEKDVENLSEGTNSFQAFILDADNNVIGESKKIEIKINSGNPEFKSIKIDPTGEVEALQEISIEVVSNMGLTSVTVIINDVMTQLTEGKDGIYSGTTKAPKDAGEYPIDVILKDEFAHQTMERGVETLIVSGTPELNAGGEIETIDTPANTTELNLTIKNIKVTELKTKSVMTWDALPDAVSYNVYKKISDTQVQLVQNVTEPRFEVEITGDEVKYEEFAIKAVGKNASGSTIQGDLSEMTKVQTGPEVIILALLALLLGGGFMYFQKRKAA